jgi:hypothetical protein
VGKGYSKEMDFVEVAHEEKVVFMEGTHEGNLCLHCTITVTITERILYQTQMCNTAIAH